jgi:hypothetical protein
MLKRCPVSKHKKNAQAEPEAEEKDDWEAHVTHRQN